MIYDSERAGSPDLTADVVVVGAGAVGLVVAMCLRRAGKNVVVLEAGGESVEERSQGFLRDAEVTGRAFEGVRTGRFSALGGTTTAWGGQLVPFDPIVFEDRSWVSDTRWPIKMGDMAPYYRRAAALIHAKDPLIPDVDLWSKIGASMVDWGEDIQSLLTQWLRQPNFGTTFLRELLSQEGPSVVLHARVSAIDALPDGRVRSVSYITQTGKSGSVNASCFVLASGTVEIVRLLKAPLLNCRTAAWSDNPLLGRYFIDHVDCFAGSVHPIDKSRFHDVFDNALVDKVKYFPRLKLSARAQRLHRMVGVAGHLIFDSLLDEHLQNFKAFSKSFLYGRWPQDAWKAPAHAWQLSRVMLPLAARYVRSNRILSLSDRGIRLRLTCEQIPVKESYVSISSKRDTQGVPLAQVNWTIDGREIESMRFLAVAIRERLWKERLAEVDLDDRLMQKEPSFLDTADDANHQMGGARIGISPDQGVIDSNLRVYGSQNLYVAGAAAFPTTGFENPTLTAIALGVRLAEHLTRSVL